MSASFLLVAVVIVCTPGPDTALTVRTAASEGRAAALGIGLGVATGQLMWTIAATVGLTAMLAASNQALRILRAIGGLYLVWLGLLGVYQLLRRRRGILVTRQPGHMAYRQGLTSNLSNPKMLGFFVAVLPSYASTPAELLMLGVTLSTLTATWLAVIALLLGVGSTTRQPVADVVSLLASVVMVGLGTHLLATDL